jgi:hypothetical protein
MTSIIKVDTLQKANGATPTAADLGINTTGNVLQVVQATYSSQISSSTNTPFNITTVDITPRSATSKFLVKGIVMGVQIGTANGARLDVLLIRDTGGQETTLNNSGANFYTLDTGNLRHGGFAIEDLDSPATTSAITYKLRGKWADDSNPSYVNKDSNSGNSTITVMEIAG